MEVHDNETDSNILIKIDPYGEMDFFINKETMARDKEITESWACIGGFLDKIHECNKRTGIEGFIMVPIN